MMMIDDDHNDTYNDIDDDNRIHRYCGVLFFQLEECVCLQCIGKVIMHRVQYDCSKPSNAKFIGRIQDDSRAFLSVLLWYTYFWCTTISPLASVIHPP